MRSSTTCARALRRRITHSAAQPQPKDRGEISAFVPSWALCRAALNGLTSSPTGQIRLGSVAERFEGKILDRSANLRFLRRFSNVVLEPCLPSGERPF